MNNKFLTKNFLTNIAIIASCLCFVACIFTLSPWPLLLMIPSSLYLFMNKAKTKTEETRREEVQIKTYAIAILLPMGLIFIVVLYMFFIKILPSIIN